MRSSMPLTALNGVWNVITQPIRISSGMPRSTQLRCTATMESSCCLTPFRNARPISKRADFTVILSSILLVLTPDFLAASGEALCLRERVNLKDSEELSVELLRGKIPHTRSSDSLTCSRTAE